MSDDGEYVFFTSPVGLTPNALDDVQIDTSVAGNPGYARNVYEWHQGHVYLISDGGDATVNNAANTACAQPVGVASSVCLLGTDTTGANAFFTTADQLVAQDTDTELDIYDARVGGGFPDTPPPPPCAASDSCHGTGGAAPPAPTAASVTFTGPGNQSPAAARARVRVITREVKGSSVFVTIRVPFAGRVNITGPGFGTVRRTLARAGTYRFRVTLAAKQRQAIRRHHKLKLWLHVAFVPVSGADSAVGFSITVRAR
jgi:hypothetical protein